MKFCLRIIIVCFTVLLFSQCMLQQSKSTAMMDTAYKFVKAIRTKDARLFAHIVQTDSLKKSLLELCDDTLRCKDRQECIDIVNKIGMKDYYFFMYGPWKIRSQELEALQKNDFPFEQLNFKLISKDVNRVVFLVEGSLHGGSLHSITIALHKFRSNWKVVSAIPE